MPRKHRLSLPPTVWVTAEKFTQQILWVVLFAILGPLLGPRPYGLFALAMVAYGWIEALMIECASETLLMSPEPTPRHYAVANFTNGLAATAASALAVASGFPIAALIKEPDFPLLMAALSPLPFLSASMAAPMAYLQRRMQFQQLGLRSITGLIIGGTIGVIFALRGAGVWALVAQILAQRVAEAVIIWWGCRPLFVFSWDRKVFEDMRACMTSLAISKSWNWMSQMVPSLMIGALLGPAALGFFSIASRISDVMCQVVLYPTAQVSHIQFLQLNGDQEAISAAFKRLLGRLALVAFPLAIGVAAVAHVLFHVWLGPKWEGAEVASVFMSLTVLPWTLFYGSTTLFFGLRLWRLEQHSQLVGLIAMIIAVTVAAPYGLNAVCAALLIRLVLMMSIPAFLWRRFARIELLAPFRAFLGPLTAASMMGACVWLAAPVLTRQIGSVFALPTLVTLGALLYSAGVLVVAPIQARSFIDDTRQVVFGRLKALAATK